MLRRAKPDDSAGIAQLLREAFAEFEALYTPEAFHATVLMPAGVRARMEKGPVWVAEDRTKLAGSVGAVLHEESVLIRGMGVHFSARGQGVGRLLLEEVEKFAAGHGMQSLSLFTTKFLHSAIGLYRAAGFRFTGDSISPHGTELLRMEKELGK